MLLAELSLLCYLMITMTHARRTVRVADGKPVESSLTYPWMVFLNSEYRSPDAAGTDIVKQTICTGFFVDIYGSVITSGHCVDNQLEVEENGRVVAMLELHYVNVTFGVVVPFPVEQLTERVDPYTHRIKSYEPRRPKKYPPKTSLADIEPREVDIALIYLKRYETSAMDCKKHPNIQPLVLSEPRKYTDVDPPGNGFFAGFGSQPIEYKPDVFGFSQKGNLTEVGMKYRYHVAECTKDYDKTTSKLTSEFAALGIPGPHESIGRSPRFRGVCEGDSGGPYMVHESGGLRARGVASGREQCRDMELPCAEVNATSRFVDLNNKFVRKWVLDELERRYSGLGKDTSSVPKTC